jgi:hypothetical protein
MVLFGSYRSEAEVILYAVREDRRVSESYDSYEEEEVLNSLGTVARKISTIKLS